MLLNGNAPVRKAGAGFLPIAMLLAGALLVFGLAGCAGGSSASSVQTEPSSSQPEASSSASTGSSSSSSSKESSASSSSESASASINTIEVSDATLDTDSSGRYVVSATVANNSDEDADVTLTAKATLTEREIDKYGEEVEKNTVETLKGLTTITPWVESNGDTVTLIGLEAGEKREIEFYPEYAGTSGYLSDTDYTLDDLKVTVSKVDPFSERSKVTYVPDFDADIKVEILSFDGDEVTGTVTNNTDKYLTDVYLNFSLLGSNDLPIAYYTSNSSDQRPAGVETDSDSVSNLKPGGEGEFDLYVGDCDSVELVDVYYDIDQEKK